MITLLTGENSFEIERALGKLKAEFDGRPEVVDGAELETRQLPDLLMGATLFADKRLVIIKNLSENKAVWTNLSDWLERLSDDIHLVLVESKPDKRTKTYKDLQKVATVHEFKPWSQRDTLQVEKWVSSEAAALSVKLDAKRARQLVQRVGVDQWALYHALQKLALAGEVTPAVIEDIIEPNSSENVFNLFEAALKGDAQKVETMVRTLELTEDPYQVFGLLSGQAFQLAALIVSDQPAAMVAKDLGAHPFALSKLAPYAKKMTKADIKKVVQYFVEADDCLKTSASEPWLLIERVLLKVSAAV